MAYYKHPKQLLQDIPEYTKKWYGRDVAVPGISKSDGVYDWDNMLPFYSSAEGSYTEAQANAVAKLMFHCGAAVKMGYGEMSGANLTPAPLAKYFGYDADMMLDLSRSLYSLAEWTQILDNELAAGRPVSIQVLLPMVVISLSVTVPMDRDFIISTGAGEAIRMVISMLRS